MSQYLKSFFILLSVLFASAVFGQMDDRVSSKVDPFWGANEGNIFPGASVPFGMVKLGPNVKSAWTPASGYRTDEPIIGFSHTQASGTGGAPRYGNILIVPQIDSLITDRRMSYPKMNEYAEPGYYTVSLLNKNNRVRAQLSATQKVGFHSYQFIQRYAQTDSLSAHVVIDASNMTHRTNNGVPSGYCRNASLQVVSSNSLEGSSEYIGGWGGDNPYTVYYVIEFEENFADFGIWQNDIRIPNEGQLSIRNAERKENRFGAYVSFTKKNGGSVNFKVGISYLSLEKARKNLEEQRNVDFETARLAAVDEWERNLSKIKIKGGSLVSQKLFYSALRNTMFMPSDVSGETKGWNANAPHFWDFYCVWDVFRATMPLYTLIHTQKQREMVQCLLDIYKTKGWLPDAWIAGDYAYIQGGSNADVVLADALVKKIGGFEPRLALRATLKNAEEQSDNPRLRGRYALDYKKYGYVLPSSTGGAVSRTLEYSYNDYCISTIAKATDEPLVAKYYENRSLNVYTLFHPDYKMFWAKDSLKQWFPDFSPVSLRKDHWNDPYFYEGGSQIYSSYVPHDMAGLIKRHGGNAAFKNYLNSLFDSGVFSIENEPEFLIPYQYIYTGNYASTAERVHAVLTKNYLPGANGLPGQDDAGSISSWYVFSAMGIFPVAGQDLYLIGSPLFEESVIQLEGKKKLRIQAKNVSPTNIYVTKASLNGKPLKQAWFRHTQIARGGKLVLTMGSSPNGWGDKTPPPSLSTEESVQ